MLLFGIKRQLYIFAVHLTGKAQCGERVNICMKGLNVRDGHLFQAEGFVKQNKRSMVVPIEVLNPHGPSRDVRNERRIHHVAVAPFT